jgi:hypothetical protein
MSNKNNRGIALRNKGRQRLLNGFLTDFILFSAKQNKKKEIDISRSPVTPTKRI